MLAGDRGQARPFRGPKADLEMRALYTCDFQPRTGNIQYFQSIHPRLSTSKDEHVNQRPRTTTSWSFVAFWNLVSGGRSVEITMVTNMVSFRDEGNCTFGECQRYLLCTSTEAVKVVVFQCKICKRIMKKWLLPNFSTMVDCRTSYPLFVGLLLRGITTRFHVERFLVLVILGRGSVRH